MGLTNGNSTDSSSTVVDFRHRLERIEVAVKPLEKMNSTLENINGTLTDIKVILGRTSDKFFATICWALKYLGIGVFIIILLAMGAKEIEKFVK